MFHVKHVGAGGRQEVKTMDSSKKRGAEFYPPEEADEQPWNDLPESPQDSGQPPSEPEGPAPAPADAGTPRTVPPLAYLTALLAAGFLLMTAVCVLQFRDSQRKLDEVRGALENVQSVDQLQMEKAQLQERIDGLTAAAEETAQEMQELQASLGETAYEADIADVEKDMLNYLWFIQNFMESGNYAMATLATVYNGDNTYQDNGYLLNQRQREQYAEYRQQLIDLDYLNNHGHTIIWTNGTLGVNTSLGPEQAAMIFQCADLWLALKEYYIEEDAMKAASYLVFWSKEYQTIIEQHRGSFAIDQYELLKEELLDRGCLTEKENGELDYGPAFSVWEVGDGPSAD